MAYHAGARLGGYEILHLLGLGGMGEVYRARDLKLGREVALKILPAEFAQDRERVSRFEREARALAALNHPNIAAIYGHEDARLDPPTPPFIVMELVEGEPLSRKIVSPLPVDKAVAFAAQIAGAMEAAHDKGIVHRDLKPANITITPTGTVKVLDFGIAKAGATPRGAADATVTNLVTGHGVILGTAPYMSPEQARGEPVDKRTDVWAFGCVLFEMLSGHAAFPGATAIDSLTAVLTSDPGWDALPAAVPPDLVRLLKRCLEKDPSRRVRDMADIRLQLIDAISPPATPALRSRRGAGVMMTMLAVVVIAALGLLARRFVPAGWFSGAVERSTVDLSPATMLLGSSPQERSAYGRFRPSRNAIALSPDGRSVAFAAAKDDGAQQLYLRRLDQAVAAPLPGTENADGPFFSPDGAAIGFWSGNALKKVAIDGGPVVTLCESQLLYGASWGEDGKIYFGQRGAIWKVPASGGAATEIIKMPAGGAPRLVLPHVVPGGRWLLLTELSAINDWEKSQVVAMSLTDGSRHELAARAADGRFVPTGHLVFMRKGDLIAAPFDPVNATITGGEITVAGDVMQSLNSTIPISLDTGSGQFDFSRSGTLAYATGGVHADEHGDVEWIGRDGTVEPIAMPPPPRGYFLPRLSPDGKSMLISTIGFTDQNLYRYVFDDRSLTRINSAGRSEGAVWSPDGKRVAYMSTKAGGFDVFVAASDGSGGEMQLTNSGVAFPGAWTTDGRGVIVAENGDIVLHPVTKGEPSTNLVTGPSIERTPDLSPNGKWLAYVSDEAGDNDVYVRSFPDMGQKRRVSPAGGLDPAWSRDGRKLVYRRRVTTPGGERFVISEIDVAAGKTLTLSTPRVLFELDAARYSEAAQGHSFDVTPDASRFIFTRETYPPEPRATAIHLVKNWFTELRAR